MSCTRAKMRSCLRNISSFCSFCGAFSFSALTIKNTRNVVRDRQVGTMFRIQANWTTINNEQRTFYNSSQNCLTISVVSREHKYDKGFKKKFHVFKISVIMLQHSFLALTGTFYKTNICISIVLGTNE